MTEQLFTVVVTRGTVTSAAAEGVPRALAWGIARSLRAEGHRVWIVSGDFSLMIVSDEQSLDDPTPPSGGVS